MRAALGALLIMAVTAGTAGSQPRLDVTRRTIRQGEALGVTVRAPEAAGVRVRFAGRTWPVYRDGAAWRTYVAADARTPPGTHRLAVEAGDRVLAAATIRVLKVTFVERRLRVAPGAFAPEKVAEERRKVAAALRMLAGQPLWEGPFDRPAGAARVSSPYGVLSIYNGSVRGWHRGTDFAAPEGTPVRAANHGIVRLADHLPLSGNAVLLDHGLGVVTSYLHLSALRVAPGARVRRGQVLGLVGRTGVATGPHLHWGLRVNGVYVDPMPWTAAGTP